MGKKTMKGAAIAALLGSVLQFGGCFGSSWWGRLLEDAALSAAYEFIWDNDGILDLFEDDGNNVAGQ